MTLVSRDASLGSFGLDMMEVTQMCVECATAYADFNPTMNTNAQCISAETRAEDGDFGAGRRP